MAKTKSKKPMASKTRFSWRKNKNKWTNTCLDFKLLQNPSLMTNHELSYALSEYQMWRTSFGKYMWSNNPIDEEAEAEPPFSSDVLSNILVEAIARLKIIGDMSAGRFKDNAWPR